MADTVSTQGVCFPRIGIRLQIIFSHPLGVQILLELKLVRRHFLVFALFQLTDNCLKKAIIALSDLTNGLICLE